MKYKKVDIPDKGEFRFVVIQHEEGPKLRGAFRESPREIVDDARNKEGLEGELLGDGWIDADDTGIWVDEDGRKIKRMVAYGGYPECRAAPQKVVEELLGEYCKETGYKLRKVEMGNYRLGNDGTEFTKWLLRHRQ